MGNGQRLLPCENAILTKYLVDALRMKRPATDMISPTSNLKYDDALELLGYAASGRHPLEIFGYEHSTE